MPKLKSLDLPASLSQIAYDALRKSILDGQLNTDQIYNEMALAKELGISRTPVREALLELSSQGLVTFLPRRGIRINSFTHQDVTEVFELRLAIELLVAEKLAENASHMDFKQIEKALKNQKAVAKNDDSGGFMEADRKFHITLTKLAGNQRLLAIMENVRDIVHLMGIKALGTRGRWESVIAEHERVFEAVKRGDPEGARQAMKEHLVMSQKAVGDGKERD